MRFELNAEDGQMRTVPVRIQDTGEQASEADARATVARGSAIRYRVVQRLRVGQNQKNIGEPRHLSPLQN
ncbi:MAG: hypothetical protein IPM01_29510 [Burkholderiaceae bacterium]|nr:hypothetical protein [Burkholderiaceae bacterium]